MVPNTEKISSLVHQLLIELGEDPGREGLLKTPTRVAAALEYLTSGARADPQRVINDAIFTQETNSMVIVKNIEVYSLCEHHLLPFFGKCHVAYIPRRQVIGLSKIPRIVDVFARRLQVQERLTVQIAETLKSKLNARGVGVVVEARHLCMMMRGVEKQHSGTVTSAMLGGFRDRQETRNEFLSLVAARSV